MQIFHQIAEYRLWRSAIRTPLVFVPTMGALHEGHASLITHARRIAGPDGAVVASIFVNPMQFGAGEDFSRYPRTVKEDESLLAARSTDALFLPDAAVMYPSGAETMKVTPGPPARMLEGADRPGHFEGVCTVVAKLLNIITPTHMILGQKDFQQHVIVAQMIHDLDFAVNLIVAPTVREPDGLAMSSRNRYLTPEQRLLAPIIYRTLCWAVQAARSGDRDADELSAEIRRRIDAGGLETRYAAICNSKTLMPTRGRVSMEDVILTAAKLGTTRLIDNMRIAEEPSIV
ncbi:MAG: pantoate--beta-alanine ligase [Phycisphaerae bacterium]